MAVSTLAVLGGALVVLGLLWFVAAMALEHWVVRCHIAADLDSPGETVDVFEPVTQPKSAP